MISLPPPSLLILKALNTNIQLGLLVGYSQCVGSIKSLMTVVATPLQSPIFVVLGLVKYPKLQPSSPGTATTFVRPSPRPLLSFCPAILEAQNLSLDVLEKQDKVEP